MPKAAKHEGDLLARLKTSAPPRRQGWFDKVTAEQQQELLAIRTAFQAGELSQWSGRKLFQEIQKDMPSLPVSQSRFRDWLLGNG